MTKQRRFSQGRGDIAALCRAAVQSIVRRSYSLGYCGASLDSACMAEGKEKQGINKQRARPVPAGTCENEAAAKKVPAPPEHNMPLSPRKQVSAICVSHRSAASLTRGRKTH